MINHHDIITGAFPNTCSVRANEKKKSMDSRESMTREEDVIGLI